jgi:hypothetical protein
MEYLGSLFLVLALLVAVALFVGRPFFRHDFVETNDVMPSGDSLEHHLSTLLAERDRVLNSLQELEFDYTLGKIPAEDYPLQRAELLKKGSHVLRQLDAVQPANELDLSAEDRIEAAVASRRADAVQQRSTTDRGAGSSTVGLAEKTAVHARDDVEDKIAARRRQRQEKASGFCPRCGRPVLKSDKFCSKCGTTL